ncbi:starvation-inducible DNA-binding protein [Faunimonas pinastri]|uniref:Starvation-inducible DNA-binding protein n=1 Tax=Faunimonas pinastri TaxID=1855383 RepID=A0A1H8Z325_9HYPH|nr:DNA starvation/stationary phase protection protein Dps [Faunimonas pinastri]SEP58741.1 starvation-inducible DNA-binding protein [Faunimonas pinastri]
MHATKHSLPAQTRKAMVGLLQANLADSIDLGYQAKQAHWNVKGMNFIAVHKLFDELHEQVEGYVDLVAERLTALGGQAEGTVRAAAKQSRLPEYPLGLIEAHEHLEKLSDAFALFGTNARKAIDEADEAGDQGTADLFTEIVRGTDESLYFLESHLQGWVPPAK